MRKKLSNKESIRFKIHLKDKKNFLKLAKRIAKKGHSIAINAKRLLDNYLHGERKLRPVIKVNIKTGEEEKINMKDIKIGNLFKLPPFDENDKKHNPDELFYCDKEPKKCIDENGYSVFGCEGVGYEELIKYKDKIEKFEERPFTLEEINIYRRKVLNRKTKQKDWLWRKNQVINRV